MIRAPGLFDALMIGETRLPNRIMMSPMSQNCATDQGDISAWHMVHYGSRAVGRCGFVMVEDTGISSASRAGSQGLGLDSDSKVASFSKLAMFCRDQGAIIGIQLAHGGRKAHRDRKGWGVKLIAPSAIPYELGWNIPRVASETDVAQVIDDFVAAVGRAKEAGFDAVEIHAAHGYLLHQFLSPLTNRRDDRYGGDVAGRATLLLEVIRNVRRIWPAPRMLMVRLPASDVHPRGLAPSDIERIARLAKAAGADMIDLAGSSLTSDCGTLSSEELHTVAARFRQHTAIPVAVGGGIRTARDAQELLNRGCCDLVTVGRPLLADPYWVLRAAQELNSKISIPSQYLTAFSGRDGG